MNYQLIIDKYYPEGSPLRDIYLRHCRQVADKALAIADAKGLCLPQCGSSEKDTGKKEYETLLDRSEIEAAAMLHDIGIFLCDAPGIECRGSGPYLRHGMLGADLLRRESTLAPQNPQAAPSENGSPTQDTHAAAPKGSFPIQPTLEESFPDQNSHKISWFEKMARVAERHTGSGISREDIIADDLPLPLDRCFLPETLLERLICYADKFFSKSGTMEEKPIGKVMVSMSRFGPESYSRFRALHAEFS